MGIVYQKNNAATFQIVPGKMNNGKLVIFSAPSGAGKTTIVKHLLEKIPNLFFSISCTTRDKRENETHGKDYYFLSVEDFKNKIENKEFIEYEEVYNNRFYGTLHSEIDRLWKEGKHVIFDVDVKGGINLKKQFKDRALAIFVSPPSLEELEKRLINRETEDQNTLKMRVEKAEQEMQYSKEFDVILVNDDLEKTQAQAVKLVEDFLK